jgi:hypothetical protein
MPDPRREGGRSPKTTGGSGRDDEVPEVQEDRKGALPQGDGDPREREEELQPGTEEHARGNPPR